MPRGDVAADWGKFLAKANSGDDGAESPTPEVETVEEEKPPVETPEVETPETETPEAEKKPDAEVPAVETPPETPAEGAAEVPSVISFKFRGSERTFDLKNKTDMEELKTAANKGLNYEALLKEDDERIGKEATKLRDNYFRETGVLAQGATGAWEPNPHGIVKWAVGIVGAENFQKALTDILGTKAAAGNAGGFSAAELDAIEKEAMTDPTDPIYAANLKMVKSMRGMAAELNSIKSGYETRFKDFDGRFAKMSEAEKSAAQSQFQNAMFSHRDAEIGKTPILKGSIDDDDKVWIMQKATALEAAALQAGRPYTPDLSKECITSAVKALSAKRASWDTARTKATQTVKTESRPKPKTLAPVSGAPKPSAAGKPATPKKGTPEWDEYWKNQFKEKVVDQARAG